MEVAKRILQLREERQWSEYRLAKEAGISQSTLSNLSSRGNNPSVYTLEKIAGAFGLSFFDMILKLNKCVFIQKNSPCVMVPVFPYKYCRC